MGKLIILSGPSCVGKSPLDKALSKFYPNLRNSLQHLVLYNSRNPRPGEQDGIDYHFRTREQILDLKDSQQFAVMEVRGDLQALDIKELNGQLNKGDVFFEGNPYIGRVLQTHEKLENIEKLSAFMAPVTADEIASFSSPENHQDLKKIVTDIMRRKLLRRTRKQQGELSLKDLENIEKRAESALAELQEAPHFDCVIPNHDGEDSENWDAFYHPIGDARLALVSFAQLLKNETPTHVEYWSKDMFEL
jgi:guanylate kinase